MTGKRKTFLLFLVLALAAAGAAGWHHFKKEEVAKVQTAKIERIDRLDLVVSASGEILAKEFVDIQAEIPGVIVDLPVSEGQSVELGDTLLRIDPFQAKQDMESARAQYDAAIADAGSAEVQIAYAEAGLKQDEFVLQASESEMGQMVSTVDRHKKKFQRAKELFEQGIASPDDYEEAESALAISESQLLVSKAKIAQADARLKAARVSISQLKKQHEAALRRADGARANLERMDDLYKKTTVVSPLKGVITKLNVEKGERAVPGIMSNPQATLMTIADLSVLEAEIRVDETDIIEVSVGDPAIVVVDALAEIDIDGHVTEIGNSPITDASEAMGAQANQQGRDFKVVIRLTNPPSRLRPGLTASADIFADKREQCLVAPIQAVTVREVPVDAEGIYHAPSIEEILAAEKAEKNEKPESAPADGRAKEELEGVFVRAGDRARFRPVKLGVKGETDIEILSGLAEGDEIVIGPYKVLRTLKDGDRVQIDEEAPAPPKSRAKGTARRGKRP
jgi:HlyD family secretion protein